MRKSNPASVWWLIALTGWVGACGGQSTPPAATPTQQISTEAKTASDGGTTEGPSAAPGGESKTDSTTPASGFTMADTTIVPAKPSEELKKMPKPWIETPGFDQFVAREWVAAYKVLVKVPNWDAVPPGSYLQFFFDGRPLPPITNFQNGLKLVDLVGQEALGDGEHIIVAYAARPNHEVIKGPAGVSVHRFWIGKKSADTYKARDPMFILGRPWGTYKGDAANDILIDWYVLNAVLEKKQYAIRMVLKGPGLPEEGVERYVTEWRPWMVVSAHPGEYTLQADLMDPRGKISAGTWTSVTRTFKVEQ